VQDCSDFFRQLIHLLIHPNTRIGDRNYCIFTGPRPIGADKVFVGASLNLSISKYGSIRQRDDKNFGVGWVVGVSDLGRINTLH